MAHSVDFLRTMNSREKKPKMNLKGRNITDRNYNLGKRLGARRTIIAGDFSPYLERYNDTFSAPNNIGSRRRARRLLHLLSDRAYRRVWSHQPRLRDQSPSPSPPPTRRKRVRKNIENKRKIYREADLLTGFNGNPLTPYRKVSKLKPQTKSTTRALLNIPSPKRRKRYNNSKR